MDDHTKDYIINFRISKDTYEKIRTKARENGDSISSLLRTIIDDSAEIFSDISSDSRGTKRTRKFTDIASYHRGVLAKDRPCDGCGDMLKKGEMITIGDTARGPAYYFCARCK